ncbi:sigma-70 family RNA polymerase sigma factor [Kaistia dalseonensis]|uniref:RNA polymerase sigma-70 factor (ECF subfamily) n=1 Tax=Kaistia dalseonensis TaxID=410840 RepID=A0ABU0HAI9_9HYPH|nr:sigma-70 family RNA polymerase sigma factor [Kaistia dalseonensis]MCX5496666.1 sigma-70 family RNA polymerase sigma factor [Kaistia dalseonensis]MDQ0439290.1 RNA polymerase sigma-70 factor (ECF subfamily) [Kaistia dalseonensis]
MDASAAEFEQHRRFLTGLAYRMLGSFADAQDIVQDAFLRWHQVARADLASPRAWLAQVVTRLCLDVMKAARSQRVDYVGPWLPEPIIETLAAPENTAIDDRIDAPVALMLALERLSPLERAAFILHDVFDMDFAEIAIAIERTEPACRQLLVRARGHIGEARPRYAVDRAEAAHLATAFFDAIRTGDAAVLRDLLAEGARLHSDGGGKVLANLNIIEGEDKVLRFFVGLAGRFGRAAMPWSRPLLINGLPGYVSRDPKGNLQTTALEITDGRITAIYIVRNPDKLEAARAVALA